MYFLNLFKSTKTQKQNETISPGQFNNDLSEYNDYMITKYKNLVINTSYKQIVDKTCITLLYHTPNKLIARDVCNYINSSAYNLSCSHYNDNNIFIKTCENELYKAKKYIESQ